MANTYRKKYHFTVKEHGDDNYWLLLEHMAGDLSCLSNGFLGFDLKHGITMDQAKEIAQILNQNIITVSYTEE